MKTFRTTRFIGLPKLISSVFLGAPNKVNSAFVYLQAAYLISEGVYYKADMVAGRLYTRKANSPFENAPKRIDGVFSWPNFYTEMFSGSKYYQAKSGSTKVYNYFIY